MSRATPEAHERVRKSKAKYISTSNMTKKEIDAFQIGVKQLK